MLAINELLLFLIYNCFSGAKKVKTNAKLSSVAHRTVFSQCARALIFFTDSQILIHFTFIF